MQLKKFIILAITLAFISCLKEPGDFTAPDRQVTVGFVAGGQSSRTTINSDGISTSWSKDDKIALWANNADGTAVLTAQPFGIYYRGIPSMLAMFTATLSSAMAEGTYQYYATYPVPTSINGQQVTFNLPGTQDGSISNGAAIMIATPAEGPQLDIVTGSGSEIYEIDDNHLSLTMNHAMHALKFFVMKDKWGFNESDEIERVDFIMPQNIAGDVTLDYTNPYGTPSVANGANRITLNLATTLGPTTSAANPDFAAASIIPTSAFAEGEQMEVRFFTADYASRSYISLTNRPAMQAGHITPVPADCSEICDRHTIRFIWGGSNLGEDVHTITFHTSDGNEIYRITDAIAFMKKGRHDIDFTFEDKSILETIAGTSITVKYESENAIVSNSIIMPTDLATAIKCHEIPIVVPYLFEEYFDTLTTYDGDYTAGPHTSVDGASSTARDLSQYGLSSGWSGARTGCNAEGVAILVSARRDKVALGATNAYGRLESPALSGIKSGKKVNVKVSFTYSGGRSGNSKFASTAVCGYTTDTGLLNGYATQFNDNISFQGITGYSTLPTLPTSGSAAAATTPMEYSIANCASNYRLSWHIVHLETSYVFISNGYGMLYIDNIQVQIVK